MSLITVKVKIRVMKVNKKISRTLRHKKRHS